MTTDYAQQVHLAARVDVHRNGRICADTALALMALGYTQPAVADLEQRLIDEVQE